MKHRPLSTKKKANSSFVVSIAIGIAVSFVITYGFEIQLSDSIKILLAVVSPVIISISAIYSKKKKFNKIIESKRLWSGIVYGLTYGTLNFLIDKAFFEGLKVVSG